ncbi:hypothetical protein QAD02_003349 [Eretmocerus hayati]|uniref:Uncharacterized protein n=1 Tax=Eretmocerus hayati TaxID=131215 RepID=A0ACC2NRC3_9HYME|nr:hypothetical protein QAD02_003349 [Eretmocerus hayati]
MNEGSQTEPNAGGASLTQASDLNDITMEVQHQEHTVAHNIPAHRVATDSTRQFSLYEAKPPVRVELSMRNLNSLNLERLFRARGNANNAQTQQTNSSGTMKRSRAEASSIPNSSQNGHIDSTQSSYGWVSPKSKRTARIPASQSSEDFSSQIDIAFSTDRARSNALSAHIRETVQHLSHECPHPSIGRSPAAATFSILQHNLSQAPYIVKIQRAVRATTGHRFRTKEAAPPGLHRKTALRSRQHQQPRLRVKGLQTAAIPTQLFNVAMKQRQRNTSDHRQYTQTALHPVCSFQYLNHEIYQNQIFA